MQEQIYTFSDRLRWQRLNRIDKRRIDAEYKILFGGENSVSEDRDKTIMVDGVRMNVLSWAINRSKAIRGKKECLSNGCYISKGITANRQRRKS